MLIIFVSPEDMNKTLSTNAIPLGNSMPSISKASSQQLALEIELTILSSFLWFAISKTIKLKELAKYVVNVRSNKINIKSKGKLLI